MLENDEFDSCLSSAALVILLTRSVVTPRGLVVQPLPDSHRACRGAMAEHCGRRHLVASAWLSLLTLARYSAAFCELESQESCMEKFVLQGRCPMEAGCMVGVTSGCIGRINSCKQPQACYNSQPSPCSGLPEEMCSSAARCRWVDVLGASDGEDPGDGKALSWTECLGISAGSVVVVLVCFKAHSEVRRRQARQWLQAAMEERRKQGGVPECKEGVVVLQPCGDTAVAMEIMDSGISSQRTAWPESTSFHGGAHSSEDETPPPVAEATGAAESAAATIPLGSAITA